VSTPHDLIERAAARLVGHASRAGRQSAGPGGGGYSPAAAAVPAPASLFRVCRHGVRRLDCVTCLRADLAATLADQADRFAAVLATLARIEARLAAVERAAVVRAAYEAGRLPDARIHLRAERYAVKLFLAHLHEVWFTHHYGRPPPAPYPIAHGGHAHVIAVPPG